MKIVLSILFSLILLLGQNQVSLAQVPGTTIGFRNDTKTPIIVQGTSKVNNLPRRGQPIFVPVGRIGFDSAPIGIRFINIYDAQQRILLADFPIIVQNRDLLYSVIPSPTQRDRVILILDAGQ